MPGVTSASQAFSVAGDCCLHGAGHGKDTSSQSLAFVTISLILISGEGRLEVCGHGGRSDIPLAVHYRLLPGDHWALPSSILGWNDLILCPLGWLQGGLDNHLLVFSNWSHL